MKLPLLAQQHVKQRQFSVRYLDLPDETLRALGWPSHPAGRYISLDDLEYLYDAGRFELGEVIAAIRACETTGNSQ